MSGLIAIAGRDLEYPAKLNVFRIGNVNDLPNFECPTHVFYEPPFPKGISFHNPGILFYAVSDKLSASKLSEQIKEWLIYTEKSRRRELEDRFQAHKDRLAFISLRDDKESAWHAYMQVIEEIENTTLRGLRTKYFGHALRLISNTKQAEIERIKGDTKATLRYVREHCQKSS